MAEEAAIEEALAPVRRRSRVGRAAKWVAGGLAALILLIIAGLVVLNTPLGERYLAERIARQTFPSGLTVRIGRIEGDLYGEAVLHDVVLSDPRGVFLTIPRAEIDWNPRGWLSNRLDIDSLAARRATLRRIPEFLPSKDDKPFLPGFDISVDRLVIDNLTLAPGIAGERAQRVDLLAELQVEDRRLFVDAKGRLGREDRFALLLNAEPEANDFDLSLDYRAPEGGALAGILGAEAGYSARIRGAGSWTNWNGGLLVQREGERFAALKLSNRSGRFGLLGEISPEGVVDGTLARALGDEVAVKISTTFDNRVFDGRALIVGEGIVARADGVIDLAENRFEGLEVEAALRDPELFGPDLRLENARLAATLTGEFDDLSLVHELSVERLAAGETIVEGLLQSGTARYNETRWVLPLDLSVERLETGSAWLDPRLVNGTARGRVTLTGTRLASDDLRLVFPAATANLALRGDLARGSYQIKGPVRAQGLELDNVGTASGTAVIDFSIADGSPWRLAAQLDARIAPVTNATLANLAGPTLRARGSFALGAGAPVAFNRLRIDAAKLQVALSGRISGGTTTLAGRGTHVDFGDFTVEAKLTDAGPEAVLVFAEPYDGLSDVRVALSPTENGFAIDTEGQSLLGPFEGELVLLAPARGPTRIDIERLTVSNTQVSGGLTLADGGVAGTLALSGGGLDGTIALAPRGGGQGVELALTADNARFGGATPLSIARAQITASGLIRDGRTDFSGRGTAQGISYGTLFIGRLAAQGEISNGVGRIDASLAGRRGGRLALDLNALIRPGRIAVAARGVYGGKQLSTPRRAVLTSLEGGGWALAPTQISYGDGDVIASGRFGGDALALDLKLADMPLSLIDVAMGDLGLGGTISGLVEYRVGPGGLPVGSAKVKVDDLSRSGLILTSKPVDLSLVARLTATRLEARALLRNEDIQRGRLQARITDLPRSGDLIDRLRAGDLSAQLRYSGAAESLWRLAAVDAFDITGPVSLAANATGSLADPRVRGSVTSDGLRIRSTLSGTDIRDVALRGRFEGSRLQIARFSGTTQGDGRVVGSGLVDLQGLGERVTGDFLEVRGPKLDLRIAATNAKLVDARGLSATVTGPLRIVSSGLGGTIAGRVQIDRASWRLGTAAEDVRLPRIATREINAPADRAPQFAASRPWRYLIDAQGSSRIDVDGMGLDSEWEADIRLRGNTEEPRILGSASVVRGFYSFAGTRFELTRGEIDFDGGVPVDPRLDIRAETEADGLNVIVRVSGTASQPEITFSSIPALPEEEILARLLFGGSIQSLSATDALQLGAALASLRGGGGMDPINQLRTAIGLDRLRIVGADPTIGRGTGIALGKNFGRRFYVELITDGRGYSATELEFRVTSWLSLLAAVSTIGRESISAEISRDY